MSRGFRVRGTPPSVPSANHCRGIDPTAWPIRLSTLLYISKVLAIVLFCHHSTYRKSRFWISVRSKYSYNKHQFNDSTTLRLSHEATYLGNLLLNPLSLRCNDLNIHIVVLLIHRLSISTLILSREQMANGKQDARADDVADANDYPRDVVAANEKQV